MEQEGRVVGEYEVMPDERLKSCPFCGSSTAPYVTRYWDEGRHDYREFEWQVICNFNKGGCGSSSGVCCDEQEAIDLWNRRAQ